MSMLRILLVLLAVTHLWAMSRDRGLQENCITPTLSEHCLELVPDSVMLCMEVRWLPRFAPATNRTIVSHNALIRCAPASTQKLITCAAALDLLTSDYCFTTMLAFAEASCDTLSDGRCALMTPLHVMPGGDPTLTHRGLDSLIARLDSRNIDTLSAGVELCYGRYLGLGLGPGWMWDDGDGAWAARPSASTIDGNCLLLYGDSPLLLNACNAYTVEHRFLTGIYRPRLMRDWREGIERFLVVSGEKSWRCSSRQERFWGDFVTPFANVSQPEILFVNLLQQSLDSAGICSELPTLNPVYHRFQFMDTLSLYSPPLSNIVDTCLTNSWNLAADNIFLELSAMRDGVGSWERSSEIVQAWVRDSLCITSDFVVVDGSGMSRYNRLHCALMCDILESIESGGFPLVLLPRAGVEGTLHSCDISRTTGYDLLAKSGSFAWA